jgi:hypothetical protein
VPVAKSAGKAVFGDIIGGLIYAPVFWYGRGLIDAARYCGRLIVREWQALGVGVWVVNIFVPMYAQRDLAGTLISFFMRLIQIFARSIAMLAWVIVVAALFIAYVIVPIFVTVEFIRQLGGLFSL